MDCRRLGEAGPVVSRVAFGNSLTAGNQLADDSAVACVRAALEAGITTFDTADVYSDGRAEEVLGAALSTVPRDRVVICTKVGRGAGGGAGGLAPERIRSCLDASLKRLGTDYLDLYQAHLYDDATPLEETMRGFAEAVAAGKVRAVGVSEWAADELAEGARLAREMGVPLVSNQPQYNMLWRVIEREVIPACEPLGIGQVVWSPLAGGVLSGKYRPGAALPEGSRAVAAKGGDNSLRRWKFLQDDTLERVQRLRPLAAEAGLTLPQLALAWTLHHPTVTSAVIGASSPAQIAGNLKALDVALEPDLLVAVDEVLADSVVRDPDLTLSRMLRRPRQA
ncbi:aldo/keto reductase [Streptomyces sp. NPDC017993]|uniref:aldo/keto reductase n=1 Tax=Streptomyces sp. NPDC017993 TaxID=3365027 RepID=UPI00378D3022